MHFSIETINLYKKFTERIKKFYVFPVGKRDVVALNYVNLRVKRGEIFGLLGPNGAGKTTLIKILSTLILPDEGEVYVDGYNVVKEARKVRARIGLVTGGERSIYWKLTARENLLFFARLYKLEKKIAEQRVNELLELMNLEDRADDKIENYSSGMKMKIILAKALIHDPPILLLDEPTLGLDPAFAREIRTFIKEQLNEKEGKTILLTTHYMEEADMLCDSIALIDRGKIIRVGTPEELKKEVSIQTVLVFQTMEKPPIQEIETIPYVEQVLTGLNNGKYEVKIYVRNSAEAAREVLNILNNVGIHVISFRIEEPTLEDVFIKYTGRRLKDEEGNTV